MRKSAQCFMSFCQSFNRSRKNGVFSVRVVRGCLLTPFIFAMGVFVTTGFPS